jgi:phosphosulfolactate phosphohydrolase-like enzyme
MKLKLKVNIASDSNDVKKFNGTAIIIDFFRFSSTIISLLTYKRKIKIFADEKKAVDFYKMNPDYDFFSEREIDIKKYDNSPYLALKKDIKNNVIVLTNSGSKAVNACVSASDIVIATVSNISAVKKYLLSAENEILIIPACIFYDITNCEDFIAARYISDYLVSDSEIDIKHLKNEIEKTGRMNILRRERKTADMDLDIIFSLNRFDVVPRAIIKKDYAEVVDVNSENAD